jgi:hypothetical protein
MDQREHAAVLAIHEKRKPQLLLAVEAAKADLIRFPHWLVPHDFRVLHSSSVHWIFAGPRGGFAVSFAVPLASYAPSARRDAELPGMSVAFRRLKTASCDALSLKSRASPARRWSCNAEPGLLAPGEVACGLFQILETLIRN